MPITVRRVREASVEDLDHLVRLLQSALSLHANSYPDIFRDDADRRDLERFWLERLADEVSMVAVADLDERMSGFVLFERREEKPDIFHKAVRQLYIHQIAVDPELRRAGIGSALMNHVEEKAVRLKIDDIALTSWSFNHAAQAFFAARGFHSRNALLGMSVQA